MNIFLLAGQSNMAGRGPHDTVEPLRHSNIQVLGEEGWTEASDPLHSDRPTAGVGLAMSFAQRLLERSPQATIGLVPCAEGGSALSRWTPGQDLSERALALGRRAMEDGELRGILWHQGESDAGTKSDATSYAARLTKVIAHLREQLNATDVPFVAGEIGLFLREDESKTYFAVVNEALRTTAESLYSCASARDLTDTGDHIHFDSASLREFGCRYAEEYLRLIQEHHLPPLS